MENPRDKWDALWELMQASMQLGAEVERLPAQETIESYRKAYLRREQALAKAVEVCGVFPPSEQEKS